MNIQKTVALIRNDLKYFGIGSTAYDVGVRLLNRFTLYQRLTVVALSESPVVEPLASHFHFRRIPPAELAEWAATPEYDINPVLLEEVTHEQNSCFGIFDGPRLAQYLFFFTEPTMMSDDLQVRFNSGHAYLCATFTHPDYRGLHLNSIGVGLGAEEYQRRGYKVLLAYVESNNFSSLRSLHRIGWHDVGSVGIIRAFGRYFIRNSSGCRPYGFHVVPFRLEPAAAARSAAHRRAS